MINSLLIKLSKLVNLINKIIILLLSGLINFQLWHFIIITLYQNASKQFINFIILMLKITAFLM